MISPSSIDEVLQRSDIIEIVGQFVRLKKRGTNYIANCPFHNEKTPSFSVSSTKGIFKCFGCGKGGNVVTFVQEHEKLSFIEAIRWLADYYKIALEETERSPEEQEHIKVEESLRILNDFATQFFQDTLIKTEDGQAIGLSYFKQRGLSAETIQKFRLGYNHEQGNPFLAYAKNSGYSDELLTKSGLIKERNGSLYDAYRGRVIFPIQGLTGRVLGFGARILKSNDKAPKYVNTPENELYIKSRTLYGLYQARQSIGKLNECFLVEGYLDVIALHQAGVENAVASSGTSLTEEQLRSIGQLTKNLTILYDGDAAGIKAALRGLDMALSQSFNVQLVLLPDGDDPDSYVQKHGREGIEAYIKENKQDVINFRLHIGLEEAGVDPVKKSKLVNEIAETISRIDKAEDFTLQEYYIKESCRKLGVEEAGFITLVNKYIRERLDAEKRTRQRDNTQQQGNETPDAPVIEQGEQPLPATTSITDQERQEWELIRLLLEYGSKAYDGYAHIADYIQQRVVPELFETPLARKIFELYFEYWQTNDVLPELQYFTTNPDAAIQQKIAGVLHHGVEVSPKWKENFGIEAFANAFDYISEVDSGLAWFEIRRLRILETEILKRLATEKDMIRLEKIMKKYLTLKEMEKNILQRHGTVFVKSAK